MAVSGFFTYYDLYGGKAEFYHRKIFSEWSSSSVEEFISALDDTDNGTTATMATTLFSTVVDIVEINPSDTLQISTTTGELHELVQSIPFAYFQWFLVGLAVIFTLLLSIIYACYCRGFCRSNGKTKQKKDPTPNFYRYRSVNRRIHECDVYGSTVPLTYPSPIRPCAPKSVERLNRLLRQGLDAVGSPQSSRTTDVSLTEPPSTFTSSASNLLNGIKSRITTQSSESSVKVESSYETQHAKMALADDSSNSSSLIHKN